MVEEKVLTAAKEYAAAVRKTMNVRDIFLYGSHARGEAKKTATLISLSWQIRFLVTILIQWPPCGG